MYIYPNTFETICYHYQPYEPFTTELFEQAIQPAATVLDIGAQFGYFSLIAARKVGHGGCVYSFEPAPANFELLQRNIELNRYIDIICAVPKAVGSQHAMQKLFVYQGSDSHSMYCHPKVNVKNTIMVECISIDEFLGEQRVDVIKMDIEGNEAYALEGMKKTIARSNNLKLFIEFSPANLNRAGVKPQEYLSQLTSLGFDIKLIDERSRSLTPIQRDFAVPNVPIWYANLYCTKKR